MNPLVLLFKHACYTSARHLGVATSVMIRDFQLNEFVTDCIASTHNELEIAHTAIEYFCDGVSASEPEFQFATLAVCLFLHAARGGAPGNLPLGQLDDLVKFLKAPWTLEGLDKLLTHLF